MTIYRFYHRTTKRIATAEEAKSMRPSPTGNGVEQLALGPQLGDYTWLHAEEWATEWKNVITADELKARIQALSDAIKGTEPGYVDVKAEPILNFIWENAKPVSVEDIDFNPIVKEIQPKGGKVWIVIFENMAHKYYTDQEATPYLYCGLADEQEKYLAMPPETPAEPKPETP